MAPLIPRRLLALVTIFAIALTIPVAAMATGRQIIEDLNDNGLVDSCYVPADFEAALRLLQQGDSQYDSKADTIKQAQTDHIKAPGLACPNPPPAPSSAAEGSDSSVPGYVVVGIVGAAVGLAALMGGVLARRSRTSDDSDDHLS